MTAIQNRPFVDYAPSTYRPDNVYAPVRAARPTQPARGMWGAPCTPLHSAHAAGLDRPALRSAVPMPVVILLSTVIVTIAIAVAWALSR